MFQNQGLKLLFNIFSTSFAPFACTPDELGENWVDGRVNLPLVSTYNKKKFGDPNAKGLIFLI